MSWSDADFDDKDTNPSDNDNDNDNHNDDFLTWPPPVLIDDCIDDCKTELAPELSLELAPEPKVKEATLPATEALTDIFRDLTLQARGLRYAGLKQRVSDAFAALTTCNPGQPAHAVLSDPDCKDCLERSGEERFIYFTALYARSPVDFFRETCHPTDRDLMEFRDGLADEESAALARKLAEEDAAFANKLAEEEHALSCKRIAQDDVQQQASIAGVKLARTVITPEIDSALQTYFPEVQSLSDRGELLGHLTHYAGFDNFHMAWRTLVVHWTHKQWTLYATAYHAQVKEHRDRLVAEVFKRYFPELDARELKDEMMDTLVKKEGCQSFEVGWNQTFRFWKSYAWQSFANFYREQKQEKQEKQTSTKDVEAQ